MTIAWSTEVGKGDWLAGRLRGAGDVGSVIPDGFERYARVFHPIEHGPCRRWSEVAARNRRVVHPEMQFHLIAHPPGEAPGGYEPLAAISVGSLPRDELNALAALLSRHTETPASCWFAVWEGYAQLHGSPLISRYVSGAGGRAEPVPGLAPPEVLSGPRLELPGRAYLLLNGAISDAADLFDFLGRQSPNLWWPEDQAWCVATDIDLCWTYVAGSKGAIAGLCASEVLEALPARITDGVTYDSDHVNAQLDER